jgi:cation:H+ antiporter
VAFGIGGFFFGITIMPDFEMTTRWACILLPLGLFLLIKGADYLVDGGVALADKLGVSPLIIGLTIVAMGTSAPEVAASITAALNGMGDMAIGNVYGSNIANLALIGGICALISPIIIHPGVIKRELPVMLGVALLLFPVLMDLSLSRVDSIILLVVFASLIAFTIVSAIKQGKSNPETIKAADEQIHEVTHDKAMSNVKCLIYIIGGLVALILGARLSVDTAKFLGTKAGLNDAVIGLTIMAIGTSLPELVTCVVAARKGHNDLSIGNLVGSNIFNTLLVVGAAGATKPFTIGAELMGINYWIMIGVSAIFVIVAWLFKKINRTTATLLLIGYVAYMIYLLKTAQIPVN